MAWLDLQLEPTQWSAHLEQLSVGRADGALAHRWRRALSEGATVDGSPAAIVSDAVLGQHRERLGETSGRLDALLKPTVAALAHRDFSLLLADADGVVVERRAGGAFDEVADQLRLIPGAVWNESTRGTNAIGTALAEKCPVSVIGAAHLARPNHGLVCYAAPFYSPRGELMGVLDATSRLGRQDPLVAGVVFAAARAIESAAHNRALHSADGGVVQRLVGRLSEPGLIVSPRGMVTHANDAALECYPRLRPFRRSPDGLARTHQPLNTITPVDLDALEAASLGQLRLPAFSVERICDSASRPVAFVLIGRPSVPASLPVRPVVDSFSDLVGSDPAVAAVRVHARQVACSTLPVLVLGETGTGKDLVAQGLHGASDRSHAPFVTVNCAGITPSLLHAEVFGYAPGAFTGADVSGREGRLAAADGGTLFLDEVGDMPSELQSVLLRFLEDGRYRRVGEAVGRRANVRLICATSRDLVQLVADGAFRSDLYYRIRGVVLTMPPLRSRTDMALLCRALVTRLVRELGHARAPFLSESALAEVERRAWPGNVRELRMALHHALVVSGGARTIEAWHLPVAHETSSTPSMATPVRDLVQTQLEAVQRALDEAGGSVSAAARSLGVARSTVYRMLKRHGLNSR